MSIKKSVTKTLQVHSKVKQDNDYVCKNPISGCFLT